MRDGKTYSRSPCTLCSLSHQHQVSHRQTVIKCLEGRSVAAFFESPVVSEVQQLLCSSGYLAQVFRNISFPVSCWVLCLCLRTCDSRLISTWHPRYFCAFYCRRAFPLLAGKRPRYLESLSVIGSGRWRRQAGGRTAGETRGILLPRWNKGTFVFVLAVLRVLAGAGGAVCHTRDLLFKFRCQG